MREGRIQMIINTPTQKSGAIRDGASMRRLAVELQIPIITTIQGLEMTVGAIKVARKGNTGVRSLTEFHRLVN
jgi:carbamoyl-phosphate synthase large subunit